MSTKFLTEQERNAECVARVIRSGFAGVCRMTGTIVDRRIFHDATPIAKNELLGAPRPGLFTDTGSVLLSTGYAGYDVDGQLVDRRLHPYAIEVPGVPERNIPEPKAVKHLKTTTVEDHLKPDPVNEMIAWRVKAEYLWNLLDDIDTASDMYKPDNSEYVQYIHSKVEQRFRILYSDGYRLRPTVERGSVGYEERMREVYPEAFNPIADRPDKVTGTPGKDLTDEINEKFGVPVGRTIGSVLDEYIGEIRNFVENGSLQILDTNDANALLSNKMANVIRSSFNIDEIDSIYVERYNNRLVHLAAVALRIALQVKRWEANKTQSNA